jgi:hypothetical protein
MFGDVVCLGTPCTHRTHACALHHVSLPDIKAAAIQCVIWSFLNVDDVSSLLGHDILPDGEWLLTLQRSLLPPSAR